ncbi:MAG: preprotein translocase subunit YajC [Phycisphaeraceae bacterium]|nr:preprotein translocase subunit YajC [Phycisphaeraceae bacterium]
MQTMPQLTVWLAQAQPGASAPASTTTYDTLGTGAATAANGAAGTVGAGGVGGAPLPAGAAAPSPFGGGSFLWILILMMVFMIGISMMSGRKERKRRAEMMSNLKKHDQVVTMGGIIGTVAEIRDDEVVIVTDESSRTRIRVTRNSVQQVLNAGPGVGGKASASEPEIHVKAKAEKAGV